MLARLMVCLLTALGLALGGCEGGVAQDEPIPGVRLGMTPRDVRDRFAGGGDGTWQTHVATGLGASDDTSLEWSATAPQSRVTHARFEFHLGMLVAIRAHLREAVSSRSVSTTPKTVTLREAQGGGTDVTVLARDCPTHREEAEALARFR